ncbi:hypothetical protein BD408DRAFT_323088, partial [Parasitella parasitica]
DVKLSISGIHLHLINKIGYTLKIAKPLVTKRNDESTLQKRVDFVTKLTSSNINYDSNCIFVDESGFTTSQIRKFARSKKGEAAIVYNKKTRDLNITILVAVS